MSSETIIYLTLFLIVPLLLIGLDHWIKKRALHRNRRNLCAKCSSILEPFQSELVPVAGGETNTANAYVCRPCAVRDKRIRRITWVVLCLSFAIAALSLWMQ